MQILAPNTLIDGRFRVESLIGQGGMANVYRAFDIAQNEVIAIKVLALTDATQQQRFWREASVLSSLRHPGVVRYIAHGAFSESELYLAMEWLEGEELTYLLARRTLSLTESLQLARRVAEIISIAHEQGVVHRDIKPSNLFLKSGQLESVTLLDFGIAHLDHSSLMMTRPGAIIGTPGYMAPEQASGDTALGPHTDFFALGCVLYQCLTGSPPFMADHLLALLSKVLVEEPAPLHMYRSDLSPEVEVLVQRLLAKKPQDRLSSASEVIKSIDACLLPVSEGATSIRVVPSLTTSEQRLLCLVFLGVERESGEKTVADSPSQASSLTEDVSLFGGQISPLLDGSCLVMFRGEGVATDQASRAARCALSLRRKLPSLPLVLATGRGDAQTRWPVGAMIERAVSLLQTPLNAGVRLDENTAGLLEPLFFLGGDEHSLIVEGEREQPQAVRTLLGKQTPFVGRERELSLLEGLLSESVEEEVARVVRVLAPPGVGKSRLRHEFLQRVKTRAPQVELLIGRGDPLYAKSPFVILAQMIRRVCGIQEGEPLKLRQQKLRARLSRSLPSHLLTRVSEFLGEMIGAPWPSEESQWLTAARQDAMLMGDQVLRAFLDWLDAESRAQPILFLIDDLHWGDLPSIRFLDQALRDFKDRAILIVAFARPELLEEFPKLWQERGVIEVPLGALSKKASERLAREILGPSSPSVTQVAEQACGNAFYLEELCRAVRERGAVTLPDTVLSMASARLEGLPAQGRRALRAASIFGQSFWVGGVSALLGGNPKPAELRYWLSELCEQEILLKSPQSRLAQQEEYAFRHSLLREASYATLTKTDQELGHRLAAEWLIDQGEPSPLVLASHLVRGGQTEKALSFYQSAIEEALEAGDLDSVIRWAQYAQSLGAQGAQLAELLGLEGEAHFWRGSSYEVERCALRALELLQPGHSLWCRALGGLIPSWVRRGEIERAIEMIALLYQAEPEENAKVAYVTAVLPVVAILRAAGHYSMADLFLERISSIGREAASQNPNIRGLLSLAHSNKASLGTGDVWACYQWTLRAAEELETAGNQRSLCIAYLQLGSAYRSLGAYEEAAAYFQKAATDGERLGLTHFVSTAKGDLGLTRALQGNFTEAIALEEQVVQDFQQIKNAVMEGISRAFLARILLDAGQIKDAKLEIEMAITLLQITPPYHAFALATQSQVELARGEIADALASASKAFEIVTSLEGVGYQDLYIYFAHVKALLANQKSNEARSISGSAKKRIEDRAALISDESRKQTFLHNVAECHFLVQLDAREERANTAT